MKTTSQQGYADAVQALLGCLAGSPTVEYLEGYRRAARQSLAAIDARLHAADDDDDDDDDGEWRREQAMQAGMGLGVQAYNDAMGCGSEPYEDDPHVCGRDEYERD